METPQEKRTEMTGCHLTKSEKRFLRSHLASFDKYMSSSTFIRNILTDVLSKVEHPENPFKKEQSNR